MRKRGKIGDITLRTEDQNYYRIERKRRGGGREKGGSMTGEGRNKSMRKKSNSKIFGVLGYSHLCSK